MEVAAETYAPCQQVETSPRWRALDWQVAVALALFAAALNLVQLPPFSQLNLYYATTVKSMTMTWSNFFFVSFDPGGFVSVDKPPLGLWIQTLSVKIFGFDSFSLILPQAIAGTVSVVVLFILVRRAFGPLAGLIAGALLAISPINVVVNRSNIFESLIVLTSLLAALAALTAVRHGRLRWLLVVAILIGVGFNIKSFEALLVAPACIGIYALGAPLPIRRRFIHLALFLVTLMAISLCWIEIGRLYPVIAASLGGFDAYQFRGRSRAELQWPATARRPACVWRQAARTVCWHGTARSVPPSPASTWRAGELVPSTSARGIVRCALGMEQPQAA